MIQNALAIKKAKDWVLDKGADDFDDFGMFYPPDWFY